MTGVQEYSHFTLYWSAFRFVSHKQYSSLGFKKSNVTIPTSPYVEVEQLVAKYGQQMATKHRTDGQIRTFPYKTQSDWLKISFQMMGCQKISSTNVQEKIKPVYQSTIIRKRIVRSSVPKFLHSRNKWVLNLGDTRNTET